MVLIAMLSALSVVGRIGFQSIPNVQPSTALIIICSYFLGPLSGMLLAILSTLLSNTVMGMGLWTLGQMTAWILIALMSHWFYRLPCRPITLMVCFGGIAGFLYGLFFALLNYFITGYFFAYYITSFPFDLMHSIGNVIFILLLFQPISVVFKRYDV